MKRHFLSALAAGLLVIPAMLGVTVLFGASAPYTLGFNVGLQSEPHVINTPPIRVLTVKDSWEAEGTYCGNHDGPCTVNAYINKEWVIVRLVRP